MTDGKAQKLDGFLKKITKLSRVELHTCWGKNTQDIREAY